MDQKNFKEIKELAEQIENLTKGINTAALPANQAVQSNNVTEVFNKIVTHTANIRLECTKLLKLIGAKP